jgi:hypothetical protein
MSTRVVAEGREVEAQQRVLLAAADLDVAEETGAVVGEGDRLEGAGARVGVPHLLAGAPADQAGAAVAAGEREELAVGGEGEALGRVGDAAEAVDRAQALAGRGVEDHDVAAVVGDGEGAAVGGEGAVVGPRDTRGSARRGSPVVASTIWPRRSPTTARRRPAGSRARARICWPKMNGARSRRRTLARHGPVRGGGVGRLRLLFEEPLAEPGAGGRRGAGGGRCRLCRVAAISRAASGSMPIASGSR